MPNMMEHLFEGSKLDKIDIKILNALRNDARIPLHSIARTCRISKQTASYRINKLLSDGVIKGFHADIDYTSLGYNIYQVYIQTKFVDDEVSFIKKLCSIKGCLIIMKSVSQYGYSLKIINKNPYDLVKELERFTTKNNIIYSHFILQRLERPRPLIELDQIEKRIVEELSMNARLNSLELSKTIGASYDIVHARLKKLFKQKIITRTLVVIDFDKAGFMYYNVVLKFADDQIGNFYSFHEHLKADPLVVSRYGCIGEFSYMLEIVDRDYVSINNKLNKIRSQFYSMIRFSQIIPIQNHFFVKAKLE